MGAKIQAFDIFQTLLSSHYPIPLKVQQRDMIFSPVHPKQSDGNLRLSWEIFEEKNVILI